MSILKNMKTHLVTAGALVGALAGASLVGAPAEAVIVDEWDSIRIVTCTEARTNPVVLERTNQYGNDETDHVDIIGSTSIPGWKCATWDYTVAADGGFGGLSASIESFKPGKIYCAIYQNGRMVSESSDIGGSGGEFTYCI
ncbi:hypothetical protein SEA_GOURDTHYMES_76 [Gordonia phage GourdThymes]|uniref:Uncharacterized protein n=2 Tax=Montyvirus TaxID=2733196 RepID=A0A2K9VDN2_9CAUD|nr:hypothetical protein BJD64_gp057 [Gordonia phage Hotorobo]YP_009797917.1 hypothetical protein HOS74_gp057 [Gordonia phage Flakey]QOP64729.1 hypothetical protein SEA_GOURDTHYMES_76 [Gordonia phage GourdThymes]WGH19758.1 hypothetical protein [Gordonia phage Lizzo]AMS02368.1 hypothetical protein SEA_HOTOROBO_76 [Gordonia phage Hotorobo]AUV60370.1 hypothetical protein SEA_FLAKEY_75 [Gordonia phage Flakey]